MKMKRLRDTHFRVHTAQLLQEITLISTDQKGGILKVPLNVFRMLLIQLAERAAQIDDPILNKIMFDLTLYELPEPTSPEYGKLMDEIYTKAEKQLKKEKLLTPSK